jgi:hypothetical protein
MRNIPVARNFAVWGDIMDVMEALKTINKHAEVGNT